MLPLVEGMMAGATPRWPDVLAMAAARERTSIVVGTSGVRALALAVQYADAWNVPWGPHRAQRSWCRPFAAHARCGVSRLHGSPHCESSVDILVPAPSGSETHERR